MKSTLNSISKHALLAKSTGYSEVYCRKVLSGKRSANSKGGKKIMDKYNELVNIIEVFSETTVN